MGHTYTTNLIHVVFSTSERRRTIPQERLEQLLSFIITVGKNHGIEVLAAGGIPDHVHLLISLPATTTLSHAVQTLKTNSSRWMGPRFSWQEGYGAFSVSPSQVTIVKAYIASQTEHHQRRDFREEFTSLLKLSCVEFDPKYVTE